MRFAHGVLLTTAIAALGTVSGRVHAQDAPLHARLDALHPREPYAWLAIERDICYGPERATGVP